MQNLARYNLIETFNIYDIYIKEILMKRYIRSSDDWYDAMQGCKYRVDGGPSGDYVGDYDEELASYHSQKGFESVYTNDPKTAIDAWFKAEDMYPSDAAIMTNKPEYEMELCRWVIENEDKFRTMYLAHRCPYKYDWLIDRANDHKDRAGGFYKYDDFPDQISPFCYG